LKLTRPKGISTKVKIKKKKIFFNKVSKCLYRDISGIRCPSRSRSSYKKKQKFFFFFKIKVSNSKLTWDLGVHVEAEVPKKNNLKVSKFFFFETHMESGVHVGKVKERDKGKDEGKGKRKKENLLLMYAGDTDLYYLTSELRRKISRNCDFFVIKKITYDNFINKIIIIFTFIRYILKISKKKKIL
jgi:hypothetical protein